MQSACLKGAASGLTLAINTRAASQFQSLARLGTVRRSANQIRLLKAEHRPIQHHSQPDWVSDRAWRLFAWAKHDS
jgi:hypothetical protein